MGLHPVDRVAEYTAAGLWGVRSWPGLLADQVATRADRTAVVDPPNLESITGQLPKRLTWSELDEQVDRLATTLEHQGLGAGDTIGVQLANSTDLVTTYLAIVSIGAIITPFPVQYRSFELCQMAALADVRAFISTSRIHNRSLDDIRVDLSAVPGLDTVLDVSDLPELPPSTNVRPQPDTIDANDAVTICWTSGTESTPKGVPRCPNDWYPMAISSVDAAHLTQDDVLLNPFPMVNMAGIAGMFLPWLLTGATLVQHQPFDAKVYFDQISDERVTYTLAPPTLLIQSLEQPFCTPERLQSVRVIGSGSAPLPPSMITAWRDRFDIDIINCFGSNEGISLIGDPTTVPDPTHRAMLFPRFGSGHHTWSNRASRGIHSRLIDPLDGTEITAANTPGELGLKGPGVFSGYLAGTATSDPFDEHGFYCTGDLFQFVADESGDLRFLQYVDRAKDLIVRGGMNISPAEIESLVQAHPAVAEVAVVGNPDPVLGERTRAVVSLHPNQTLTLEQLVEFLRASHIASYKLPESLTIVQALPRNPVGKILKRELRDQTSQEDTPLLTGGTR